MNDAKIRCKNKPGTGKNEGLMLSFVDPQAEWMELRTSSGCVCVYFSLPIFSFYFFEHIYSLSKPAISFYIFPVCLANHLGWPSIPPWFHHIERPGLVEGIKNKTISGKRDREADMRVRSDQNGSERFSEVSIASEDRLGITNRIIDDSQDYDDEETLSDSLSRSLTTGSSDDSLPDDDLGLAKALRKQFATLFRKWCAQVGTSNCWFHPYNLPWMFKFALHRPLMPESLLQSTLYHLGIDPQLKFLKDLGIADLAGVEWSRIILRGGTPSELRHASSYREMFPKGLSLLHDSPNSSSSYDTHGNSHGAVSTPLAGLSKTLEQIYKDIEKGLFSLEEAPVRYPQIWKILNSNNSHLSSILEDMGDSGHPIPEMKADINPMSNSTKRPQGTQDDEYLNGTPKDSEIQAALAELVELYRSRILTEKEAISLIQETLVGLPADEVTISRLLKDNCLAIAKCAEIMWEGACTMFSLQPLSGRNFSMDSFHSSESQLSENSMTTISSTKSIKQFTPTSSEELCNSPNLSPSPEEGVSIDLFGIPMSTSRARDLAKKMNLPQDFAETNIRSTTPRRLSMKRFEVAKTNVTLPRPKRKVSTTDRPGHTVEEKTNDELGMILLGKAKTGSDFSGAISPRK